MTLKERGCVGGVCAREAKAAGCFGGGMEVISPSSCRERRLVEGEDERVILVIVPKGSRLLVGLIVLRPLSGGRGKDSLMLKGFSNLTERASTASTLVSEMFRLLRSSTECMTSSSLIFDLGEEVPNTGVPASSIRDPDRAVTSTVLDLFPMVPFGGGRPGSETGSNEGFS